MAASTSPKAATSTSTSTPLPTTVRWARFNLPSDLFLHPADPPRHQLYHRIRHERWFIDQMQERPITGPEASQIPGTMPGESVLLAFHDRAPDAQNKTAFRCTICRQTDQPTPPYRRPDRAKVHIRHHFEIRPIPCNGKCDIRHWCAMSI